jgi:putative membrane protein
MSVKLRLAIIAVPAALHAHEGEPLAPHDALYAWAWDPLILLGLVIAAVLYWRGATQEHGLRRWERSCYWAGWCSLFIALVSPLHPMGEVLFSAHMAQHEILMLISAPLLVLGRPLIPYLWGLPLNARKLAGEATRSNGVQAVWSWIARPVNAWWIHAVALWGWHAPSLFQATVESDFIHTLQHLSFLGSALLFWWALLRGRHAESNYGLAVLYVFSTGVHSSILGALLTFSQRVWYPVYTQTTGPWGLTPLEDQQIGGLIMWVPAGLVFVAAGLVLFAKWIQQPSRARATTALPLLLLLALTSSCTPDLQFKDPYKEAHSIVGGDAHKGKQAIGRYGCGSCHTIPGIRGANGLVGPPLTKMALRTYIAGVLPNTPENMRRWIHDPPAVDNHTAMPKLGVSGADLEDITTYLYTLR